MKAQRVYFEWEWTTSEHQLEAPVYENNKWIPEFNSPIERNLIEMSRGRASWALNYNVEPSQQTNVKQTDPAKYSLRHFLEPEQNFWVWVYTEKAF